MTGFARNKEKIEDKEKNIGSLILYSFLFSILLIFAAIFQCSGIKIFGVVPNVTFTLVCAIGFIAGEKFGSVFGLLGGILISSLGEADGSLAPVLYVICGYLCGALLQVILNKNFLSFLVYGAVMGVMRGFFTLIYFAILSKDFNLWKLITDLLFAEFFVHILCIIPIYFIVLGIYLLFKGKNNRTKIKY